MGKFKNDKWIRSQVEYCNGKVCYDKKTAITARNKRYKDEHQKLRVYHCPDCNTFHLTSKV